MIIFSHPVGNQNVRAALKGINDAKLLSAYNTPIAAFPGTMLHSLGKLKPLQEINKRGYDSDLKSVTHTRPFKELGRLISLKAGFKNLIKHETGIFSVDNVGIDIDVFTAKMIASKQIKNAKAIYAYEDGALQSFKAAKKNNLLALYDLPIGYWRAARKLMQSEIDARPDWASTMRIFHDSEEKLKRKDEELALADHIFVASSFTAKTLQEYPGKLAKISVIPYGFPPVYTGKKYDDSNTTRPLRILFVGGLSQRKGIANIFEAAEHLGADKIELTVVGRKDAEYCEPLEKGLAKCKYIASLPHSEILELMQTQDVFVFPSLFEGFGLVITESMSQGLPVITTDRTIAPDIITHGKNGWIVEPGSTASLISCLENILNDRSQLKKCGEAAMQTASERPWERYGKELADVITTVMSE